MPKLSGVESRKKNQLLLKNYFQFTIRCEMVKYIYFFLLHRLRIT